MAGFIDAEVLRRLMGSTGGGAGVRFVRDFIQMWDVRVARLVSALDRGDFDDADVVLLSVRSGSTMLGAPTLEAIAGMIHTRVKARDAEACRVHLPRFRDVGQWTCAELQCALVEYERVQPSSEAASR